MESAVPSVVVTLRIPGNWAHPGELVRRLPTGFRVTPEELQMPDGERLEFIPMPPDEQFPQIFQTSCRRPASSDELEIVNSYTVNVGLKGRAGSLEAALRLMRGAAAIVQTGAAGVFIDNSALAHGGEDWLKMTEDGGPDALSFAFVSIIRGRHELFTMGMHVLGMPEISMIRNDLATNDELMIDVVRYMAQSDKPVEDGHVLLLDESRSLQASRVANDQFEPDSPMHNPFGKLRLLSNRDIAERN